MEPGTELEVYEQAPAPVTLFRTDDPKEVVVRATETANALAGVVRAQKLAVKIQGREHVRVEGWTLLGTMLGVFAVCEWTRKLDDGWEARVVATTRDGSVVGAAEAECLRSEKTWGSRDDYALRSMAQTRATSKALRVPLGFVMTLAGFDATPAEEMPSPATKPATPEPDTFTDEKGQTYEIVGSGIEKVPDRPAVGQLEAEYLAVWVECGGNPDVAAADMTERCGDPDYAGWLTERIAKGRKALESKPEQSAFQVPTEPARKQKPKPAGAP